MKLSNLKLGQSILVRANANELKSIYKKVIKKFLDKDYFENNELADMYVGAKDSHPFFKRHPELKTKQDVRDYLDKETTSNLENKSLPKLISGIEAKDKTALKNILHKDNKILLTVFTEYLGLGKVPKTNLEINKIIDNLESYLP